jgi:signal transduction histidine kinase
VSIRLRLALWYSIVAAVVFTILGLVSYAFHVRIHYDDLDRTLIAQAEHAAEEATTSQTPDLINASGMLDIALRLYAADGHLLESLPANSLLPAVNPQDIFAHPSDLPFDRIANLAPEVEPVLSGQIGGAFGLIANQSQRWRNYVIPIHTNGQVTGYVEAITSLARLDTSMQAFRETLLILGTTSLIAVFLISWATAGAALRPVARMIDSAQAIARSHDFSRRVEGPAQQDELHALASAFSEMLSSLEESYRAQQRFVSDASHEMRAPLTAIQANLELLQRLPNLPAADRQEALNEASREATRLTRLVADLLVLARADAGGALPHHPVELDRVLLDAVSEARHLARGHKLEIARLETVMADGDSDRLKQLFLILLDNAIKYTPPAGQITVSLHQNSHSILVAIADNGVGIPSEAMPHIFDRFYRADPARSHDPGGTGLGLPIARWIVEQHGGTIQLDSESGKGTRVKITLPAIMAAADG